MDKRELELKTEFPDMFDVPYCEGERGSLGFMDMLGFQDYGPSLLDLIQTPGPQTLLPPASEVVNTPATTPNSPSVSSSSIGVKEEEEEKKKSRIEKRLRNSKGLFGVLFLFTVFCCFFYFVFSPKQKKRKNRLVKLVSRNHFFGGSFLKITHFSGGGGKEKRLFFFFCFRTYFL